MIYLHDILTEKLGQIASSGTFDFQKKCLEFSKGMHPVKSDRNGDMVIDYEERLVSESSEKILIYEHRTDLEIELNIHSLHQNPEGYKFKGKVRSIGFNEFLLVHDPEEKSTLGLRNFQVSSDPRVLIYGYKLDGQKQELDELLKSENPTEEDVRKAVNYLLDFWQRPTL